MIEATAFTLRDSVTQVRCGAVKYDVPCTCDGAFNTWVAALYCHRFPPIKSDSW